MFDREDNVLDRCNLIFTGHHDRQATENYLQRWRDIRPYYCPTAIFHNLEIKLNPTSFEIMVINRMLI